VRFATVVADLMKTVYILSSCARVFVVSYLVDSIDVDTVPITRLGRGAESPTWAQAGPVTGRITTQQLKAPESKGLRVPLFLEGRTGCCMAQEDPEGSPRIPEFKL
jgi:hypothetical protein